MSRGVRDLRDLICVSRLTIRDSDEEYPLSDAEDGRVSCVFDELSSGTCSRQSSAHSSCDHPSPDSGISTNGHSASPEDTPPKLPQAPKTSRPSSKRRNRKRRPKPPDHPAFPLSEPLPPVTDQRPDSSSGESSRARSPSDAALRRGNFDEMLLHLDATQVAEWLQSANGHVAEMAAWCHAGENFVDFAHFWLSEFPETQKVEILRLEYGILLDQLRLAFAAGDVPRAHLRLFLAAVFREYPADLMSSRGPHLFLDALDVLSSERQSAYKRLLTNVHCSTRVKQYAQLVLAVRSFALVSVWSAVVRFYRRLRPAEQQLDSLDALPCPHLTRAHQAIRKGYVDVLRYLLATGKVKVNDLDNQQKSLVHHAVVHGQQSVLQYLLNHVRPPPDVNQAASSGNTPLHAAANAGSAALVALLVRMPGIDVNAQNALCDQATPLHLAVMHGYQEVVSELLAAGADSEARMGDLSALDIARDFDHLDIVEMLQKPLPKS